MFAERCTGLATGRRTTPLDARRRVELLLFLISVFKLVPVEREDSFRGTFYSYW